MAFSLNLSWQADTKSSCMSSDDDGRKTQPTKETATGLKTQRVIPGRGDYHPSANGKPKPRKLSTSPYTKEDKIVFPIHPSASPKSLDSCCLICTVFPPASCQLCQADSGSLSLLIKYFPFRITTVPSIILTH